MNSRKERTSLFCSLRFGWLMFGLSCILPSPLVAQSMFGFCYEVEDLSTILAAEKPLSLYGNYLNLVSPSAWPPVIVTAGTATGPQNSVAVANVTVGNFQQLIAGRGSLSWDTSVAVFTGILAGVVPNTDVSFFDTTRAHQGILSILWDATPFGPVSVANGSIMFGIEFRMVGLQGATCSLVLNPQPGQWNFMDYGFNAGDAILSNGVLTVSAPLQLALAQAPSQLMIYPNPLPLHARQVQFLWPAEMPVITGIKVWNAAGQEVLIVQNWQAQDLTVRCQLTQALPEGCNWLQIETAEGIYGQAFIVRDK